MTTNYYSGSASRAGRSSYRLGYASDTALSRYRSKSVDDYRGRSGRLISDTSYTKDRSYRGGLTDGGYGSKYGSTSYASGRGVGGSSYLHSSSQYGSKLAGGSSSRYRAGAETSAVRGRSSHTHASSTKEVSDVALGAESASSKMASSSAAVLGTALAASGSSSDENKTYRIVGRITPTPSPERQMASSSKEVIIKDRVRARRGLPLTLPEVSSSSDGRLARDAHQQSSSLDRQTVRRAQSLNDVRRSRSPSPRRARVQAPEGQFPVCSRYPNCSVCTIEIPKAAQKEHVIHEMHSELKEEIEGIAMVERKEKEIQMKAETIQQITEILQKTRKELELKTKECLRREAECKQLKLELKTCVDEKKRVEFQLSEQQINISKYESMETRMSQISERYDEALAHNKELMERIKSLEIAEREFIELERNVIDLQVQLRDFEDVEVHRDELFQKLQVVKKQRDEFLEKGRMVEEERNEFVKSNKTLEQYLIEWKRKSEQFKKTNSKLKERILSLERDKKELEDRVLEIQSERTAMQSRISKLEMEYEDLLRELREVTMERNALDQRLADCEDMLSDHDHLEEGFHSLRLKLAELSRQRDDAEMLVPSYKTKLHLLRKQVREKENTIVQMEHELKALKYAVHNSTIEDITKIKSIGNSSSDSYSRVDKQEKQFADDYTATGSSDSYQVVHRRRHQKLRPGRRYVALFDYDPYKSSTSDHPERELKLREGDYVTVYGEVDMDGFLEAEVDGVRGLVPSIYVEETSSDEGVDIEIDRSSNVRHRERKFVALYDYDPYTMGTTDRPDMQHSLRKGEVVSVYGDVDVDGYYTCYKNGKRALIPSNFVEVYSSGRHQSSSAHAQTSSRHHQHGQHVSGSSSFKGTIEIDRDDVLGPPFAPRDLKVLRVVTKRAVLLGWDLPSMDELGKSNGVLVVGYQIWVNGREKQEVRSSTMNKCLVDNVDLEGRVEFSIQTIAENGFRSEKCHFAITGALAALGEDVGSSSDSGSYKRYVALYDYDPFKSSPNPNPSLELALREGDLVKVFDTSRSDGFYHAEVHGKRGLVPSNFIQRISGSSSTHQASSSAHQSYQQESDSNSRRVSFKH